MGKRKQKMGESNEAKGSGGVAASPIEATEMIKDPRFSSAHTDPRFRRVPRRESKVTIDSRFKPIFTDKRFSTGSAPVDKRGKRRRAGSGKDSMREFYRIEEEEDKKKKKNKSKKEDDSDEESGDDSESDKEIMDLKSEPKRRKADKSSDLESEEESESESEVKLASSDEESEEVSDDTDEDEEAIYEEDELPEEVIPDIENETHRLAIVNMDWRHVSAKDLYVVLNSFVPKDGRILSVSVYPSDFGLQRMKEEEIHGPVIDGDKKNDEEDDEDEDEDEEEDEDEDVINQKLRAYEISRLKYYHAVAVCDSSATADHLYKSCDGIEFERSSNKLDLRFIPDSMEFKHPPRDVATEAPDGYEGLDFQSRALQMSKVNLSWDEDEPHRIKTLNQKFNSEQLGDLEMKEFLASDEGESDDDDDEENNNEREEKRKEKYRALVEAEDSDSDKDVENENDQDMEVTFNTGLEDLSKEILKKKDKESESVWEAHLRQRREKKRAKKNKKKDDSSSPDDDDDYNIDRKSVKDDGGDDFFMEEAPLKKKKEGKTKKKKGSEEVAAAEEKSRAELELLIGDARDGNAVKGYNTKRKGKKGKTDVSEDKIPAADILNDERFSAFKSPDYALDPTDPHFRRSTTYLRQLAEKQKEDPRSHEDVKEMVAPKEKQKLDSDSNNNLGSKKERYELSSTVKSLKMKMMNKESEKKRARNAESSSTLAQRISKKARDLSKK